MVMDFAYNEVFEHVDVNNILLAAKGYGIISSSDFSIVQRAAGANMSVDVGTGDAYIGGLVYSETSTTNVVIAASHATHARKDIIIYDIATTAPIAITGTPATIPQPPDITANDILLGLVDVSANATVINNTDITQKQIIVSPTSIYITASDVLLQSNPTERATYSQTYEKLKEIRIPAHISTNSTYRIKFDLKMFQDLGDTAYGKIYLNGVAHGTEQTETSTSYVTYSEDLVIGGGDLIQLWGKSTDIINPAKVMNFNLYGDVNIGGGYENTSGY